MVFRSPHSKSWSCKNNSVFNPGGARFYDQRLDTKLVTVADAEVSMGWVWVDPWVGLGWVGSSIAEVVKLVLSDTMTLFVMCIMISKEHE